MNKFIFQAIVYNQTPAQQQQQLEWCRAVGKHNKAWIVYHGETHWHGKFDNYYFLDLETRNAFRERFGC